MMKFETNTEYKLYCQNGNLAKRTAKCIGINRNEKLIKFQIIGSETENYAKFEQIVLKLKEDTIHNSEFACDFSFRKYLSIYAKDVISKQRRIYLIRLVERFNNKFLFELYQSWMSRDNIEQPYGRVNDMIKKLHSNNIYPVNNLGNTKIYSNDIFNYVIMVMAKRFYEQRKE